MKTLSPERVREIAAQEARNVASIGSVGADEHNTKTIAFAIQVALEEVKPSRSGKKARRDISFTETRQNEKWRNQVAADLNTLLGRAQYFRETSDDESDKLAEAATLRIVQRVAEFEQIEKA